MIGKLSEGLGIDGDTSSKITVAQAYPETEKEHDLKTPQLCWCFPTVYAHLNDEVIDLVSVEHRWVQ